MTPDSTYRAYRVTNPNASLPLSLTTARAQLRTEGITYDDALVETYIRAAASTVEATYGLALLTQTVAQYHSGFPPAGAGIALRIRPVAADGIASIAYVDADGVSQTWHSDNYEVFAPSTSAGFPAVAPKHGKEYPVAANVPNAVVVTYSAGFGADASALPNDIKAALLLIIGDLYENRQDRANTLPTASERLLRKYYPFSL